MKKNKAKIFASTKDMSHDEWLAARRNGVGGSEAAAIMGASPWATALTVYVDKIGKAPEKDETEAMRQGTDLEAYVAQRFTEATGLKLKRTNCIYQHPEHPWMLANIDRDVIGDAGGFEAKTTNLLNKSDFEAGEVPLTYMWQCQHYMAVTGAPHWYLAVLVLGKAFHVFRIDRDETLIRQLIESEREFWEEHVEKQIPPLPTGTEQDEEAIKVIYPTASETEEADLTGYEDTLNFIDLLKSDKRLLERRIAEAEEIIKLAMKTHEKGISSVWKVLWKDQTKSCIDTKRLKAENPALAAQYSKPSTSRPFVIKKLKEAM